MINIRQLLTNIFNHDFTQTKDATHFAAVFFAKPFTWPNLKNICEAMCASQIELNGKTIPAAVRIKGQSAEKPFLILAQLHGNEPAGLAGIALAMALSEAGLLKRDVIGVIGNPIAAQQYFEAWTKAPHAGQETRDEYRGGVDENGKLLPDMNRIPIDFMSRDASDPHIKRAQELWALGQEISGILDIHSARGNMLCVTDHKHDAQLKHSPIRALLTDLAEAISANASATVTLQTLKTILHALPNMESQTGIEAGRHEDGQAPQHAASFTLSLLHTLGLTDVPPLFKNENGIFERYSVRPRITYADLIHEKLYDNDQVYMVKACHALASVPERSDTVIVKLDDRNYGLQSVVDFTKKPAGTMEFALFQYDEMEAVEKNQVVAVAVPSGATFTTKEKFSVLFISKSAALYDKDPSVGPWPVSADKIAGVKFCYPCDVSEIKLF